MIANKLIPQFLEFRGKGEGTGSVVCINFERLIGFDKLFNLSFQLPDLSLVLEEVDFKDSIVLSLVFEFQF